MKTLLRNLGFQSFLWTQFLGALNDNFYKTIVSLNAVRIAVGNGSAYLAIAGVVFFLPFLLFSGYSGFLADRFSKRNIMIGLKMMEVVVMGLGMVSLFSDSPNLMLAVLFLMALQSTLFSPAKYGYVPESLPGTQLSGANALLEMTTFVAIVAGTAAASFAYDEWMIQGVMASGAWKLGLVVVAISATGLLASFGIRRTPIANPSATFRANPLHEVLEGARHILRDRAMVLTVLGISYFWMIGALFQLDLFLYGAETLGIGEADTGLMVTALAIGIGAGSLLAGWLSGEEVELGFVPLGSLGMGVACLGLYAAGSFVGAMAWLVVLGLFAGLFIVPLNAFLQQRAAPAEKGRIMATNNFINTIGLLLASGALWLGHDVAGLRPETLILISGALTLAATLYIIQLMPLFFGRLIVRVLINIFFNIRTKGGEKIPATGPALLVSNHLSLMDGFLVGYAARRRTVRFMLWKPYYDHPVFGWFLRGLRCIPVDLRGPRGMARSLRDARKALEAGDVVCVFAEGSVTRTGHLLPFKRGMEKIVEGLDVPVIPTNLDHVWGGFMSFAGGQFGGKRPEFRRPINVTFSDPLSSVGLEAVKVRQIVSEMAADTFHMRKTRHDTLPERFIRMAKRKWGQFCMADTTGKELNYGRTLTGALVLAGEVRKRCGDQKMIGLLLPSTVGGALANLGVALAGKTSVNLNFTAGAQIMEHCMEQCEIQTVLTSKAFLHKAKLEAPRGAVYLENILKEVSGLTKLIALLKARLVPTAMLRPRVAPDDLATVIFSSGSTGVPKGVMLSHFNIVANVDQVLDCFDLTLEDRILGILPFFHSFGFMATIWLPLLAGCGAAYHPVPTDAKAIGEMVEKYKGTFLLSTPTFCGAYIRKCTREQFKTLRYVVVGAEKLREPLRVQFEETFGIDLLEGYGCTEMAPVVSVNTPDFPDSKEYQAGTRHGTIGLPLPGVAAKVVDPETEAPLPNGEPGMLLVKGANRMLGYLKQPERTAEVFRGDWYVTGDIAAIDDDGFIAITDRLSRFSKIGGEMVPHLKIEDAINACFPGSEYPVAVTGVPDERKGERLTVLYTNPDLTPEQIWQRLSETDLPKLWIPKTDCIFKVDALPVLGTGKLDLRGFKRVAEQRLGVALKQ